MLGACAWELGEEKKGRERLEKAEAHAKACGNWSLVSRVRLQILEKSSDSGAPYHLSLPLCSAAVRAVHRSGDRQILADAHITFARLEARGGGIQQAIRHLNHANRLLAEQHNKWMAASARLTYALILAHQGDLESACEEAERAGVEAADSGWIKGEAIAAGNLAFFHVSAGRLRDAEESLAKSERVGYRSPSYSYAVRDTKIALAVASANFSEADRLWAEGQETLRGVASWYKLRASHTRVRTLLRQSRVADALVLAQDSKDEARQLRNEYFQYVFELSIAEIEAGQGSIAYAPLELFAPADSSLGLIGARRRVLAKALVGANQGRARLQQEAASRILSAAGVEMEWNDGNDVNHDGVKLSSSTVEIDDSVALIELAGYPHVLGREAFALLELSGATEETRTDRARRAGHPLRCHAGMVRGRGPRGRGPAGRPAAHSLRRPSRRVLGNPRRAPRRPSTTDAPASPSASWSTLPSPSTATAARRNSAPRCGRPTLSRLTAGSGFPSR